MQAEVKVLAAECSNDLTSAESNMKKVEAALNSLDRGSLGELKCLRSPPAEVMQVVSACAVLTAPGGQIPKVSCMHLAVKLMCMDTLSSAFAKKVSCQEHITFWPLVIFCYSSPHACWASEQMTPNMTKS